MPALTIRIHEHMAFADEKTYRAMVTLPDGSYYVTHEHHRDMYAAVGDLMFRLCADPKIGVQIVIAPPGAPLPRSDGFPPATPRPR